MAVNKVIYNDEVLIDLTSVNITPEKLAIGKTSHDSAGNQIIGTNTSRGGVQPGDVILQHSNAVYWCKSNTSFTDTGLSLTILMDGYYRVKWFHNNDYESGTSHPITSYLTVNGALVGSNHISNTHTEDYQHEDVLLSAGDEIKLFAKGLNYSGSTYGGINGIYLCADVEVIAP